MMNKIFENRIGRMLKVYKDEMIVKSKEKCDHVTHLREFFTEIKKFNMLLKSKNMYIRS